MLVFDLRHSNDCTCAHNYTLYVVPVSCVQIYTSSLPLSVGNDGCRSVVTQFYNHKEEIFNFKINSLQQSTIICVTFVPHHSFYRVYIFVRIEESVLNLNVLTVEDINLASVVCSAH